jgi:Putative abortive phage resistance protein AbiGi, antitoxin
MTNNSISDTLFHFTGLNGMRKKLKPEMEALKTVFDILGSKRFNIGINSRHYAIPGTQIFMEIPMTCFTETPLSHLRQHMSDFGEFGIGMKFEWAIRNGFLNVIYSDNRGHNFYSASLSRVWDLLEEARDTGSALFERGMYYTLVGITEDIRFRNEREWRLIPQSDLGTTGFSPRYVEFSGYDIDSIVIKKQYSDNIKKYIENHAEYSNCKIKIIESESIL